MRERGVEEEEDNEEALGVLLHSPAPEHVKLSRACVGRRINATHTAVRNEGGDQVE